MKTDEKASLETKIFLEHFPEHSKEMMDYIENVAMRKSSLLIIESFKGITRAKCTRCQTIHKPLYEYKHKEETLCPKCKTVCTVIEKRYWRDKRVYNHSAYVTWYEKSLINEKAIVAKSISIYRETSKDGNVKTDIIPDVFSVFIPGRSEVREVYCSYYGPDRRMISSSHIRKASTRFEKQASFGEWNFKGISHISYDNVQSAVSNTSFQYSTWESYKTQYGKNSDLVSFFSLFAKYSFVEYLTKAGLKGVVEDKINDHPTYRTINWKGKNFESILKMNIQELRELQRLTEGRSINCRDLDVYRHVEKKNQLGLSPVEFKWTGREMENKTRWNMILEKVSNVVSQKRIFNYLDKQEKSNSVVSITYFDDYLNMARDLRMDISKENVIFPRNLVKEHQKLTAKSKMKKDKALDRKIKKQFKGLSGFCFEKNGFFIRPAKSVAELINEGNKLNHCVGGYSYGQRYAEGKTIILFIRKIDEPGKPLATVEIEPESKKIRQCYGLGNKSAGEDVEKFKKEFEKTILKKNRGKVA